MSKEQKAIEYASTYNGSVLLKLCDHFDKTREYNLEKIDVSLKFLNKREKNEASNLIKSYTGEGIFHQFINHEYHYIFKNLGRFFPNPIISNIYLPQYEIEYINADSKNLLKTFLSSETLKKYHRGESYLILLNPKPMPTRKDPHSVRPKIQKWSRLSPERFYKKHSPKSRLPATKYDQHIDYIELEKEVFTRGIARVKPSSGNRIIYFYAKTNKAIDRNKVCNYIRVQFTRKKRQKGSGYVVSFHGHPLTRNEVEEDLKYNRQFLTEVESSIIDVSNFK